MDRESIKIWKGLCYALAFSSWVFVVAYSFYGFFSHLNAPHDARAERAFVEGDGVGTVKE